MKKIVIFVIVAILLAIVAKLSFDAGVRHAIEDSKIYVDDCIIIDLDGNLFVHEL